MALPVISSWPFKIIDGYKSEWNAAALPIQYGITNTKWPTNSEDSTVAITSVSDNSGNAQLNHGSSTGIIAKEWVLVAGTTNYNGAHQVLSVSGNNLIIDFPFGASETGTSQVYYQNYTTLVQVYAGIDPAHTHAATKPIELIGTIEQKPDTDNITFADVRDYVKEKLNTTYDKSQASWPNDLNGWTDFYVSFAERYDIVIDGVVSDHTSEFRDDEADGGINYLKATHSALQFGNALGGNMFDYVIKASPYFDTALFMTDFDRPKIIGDMNFDISIIIEGTFPLIKNITTYDINNNILDNFQEVIVNDGYGIYRISIDTELSESVDYIEIFIE